MKDKPSCIIKNIFFFIILFYPVLLLNRADTAELKKISVEEAVKIALENNNDYKTAELKLKEAGEKINAVWGELFPVLESEAAMTKQHAENGFMSLSDGQLDIKFIQLRFGVNPGIFYNSLQASRKAYTVSKEELKKIKSETELGVIKSYFSLILASETVKLRQESLELLKSNLKDVQNMYNTGSIPKFDLLQAKVQLNSQVPLLLDAENNYRVATDYFNYVLGSGDRFTADLSVLENSIEAITSDDMENKIDMLTSAAFKNRPELVQIQKKIEASEHRSDMYTAYYLWPTFSVGGYYGMTKNDPNKIDLGMTGPFAPDLSQISGDDKWQNTWQIKLAATYRWGSLFRLDSNSAFAKEEELMIKQAKEEMLKLKRLIAINVNSCYSKLLTAYLTIVSQKENVETATEGLRIAKESFRAGVIKNSDLLSSQFALTSAKTSYINAINSYYTALAELKKETGISDESVIFGKVKL
jgi:outer membrane protein TolC